jgi:hypothetical protein
MKRFRLLLLNWLGVFSVLLGAFTLHQWKRSQDVAEGISFMVGNTRWEIGSGFEYLSIERFSPWPGHSLFQYKSVSLTQSSNDSSLTGPVFALQRGGARRFEQHVFDVNIYYGRECAVLASNGQIDTESSMTALMKNSQIAPLSAPIPFWEVSAPLWMVVIPFFVFPFGLIAQRSFKLTKRYLIEVRSKRRGLCTKCGYDLRATPDRCPECGTVPAKS